MNPLLNIVGEWPNLEQGSLVGLSGPIPCINPTSTKFPIKSERYELLVDDGLVGPHFSVSHHGAHRLHDKAERLEGRSVRDVVRGAHLLTRYVHSTARREYHAVRLVLRARRDNDRGASAFGLVYRSMLIVWTTSSIRADRSR